MTYDGNEIESIVFYDKQTKEICAMVSDEDIVIPENCEVAIFPIGTRPIFHKSDGMVVLKGAAIFPSDMN